MNRPRLPRLFAALLLAFAAPIAHADDPHAAAFYEAFYLESGLRDFERAEQAYASVASKATTPAAKNYLLSALVGRGRCLIALGRRDEAKRVLDSALALEPGHAEAAKLMVPPEDAGIDPELKARITALVQKLATAEREQAYSDLEKVGAIAFPFLADGLRSRDVAVVEASALLLGKSRSPLACAILVAAFEDPGVVFPRSLVVALKGLGLGAGTFDVLEVAMRSPDPEMRMIATSRTVSLANATEGYDRARAIAILERALAEPDLSVSKALPGFGNLDRQIVVALADALVPWMRRLEPDSLLHAVQSIGMVDPPSPELDAFAAECLRHADSRVRLATRTTWLLERLKKGAISDSAAIQLILDCLELGDRDARESLTLLQYLDVETIRAAHDPLVTASQSILRRARDRDELQGFEYIANEFERAAALADSDIDSWFAILDDRWSATDPSLAERLLDRVEGFARRAVQARADREPNFVWSRESDPVLRAIDAVKNIDLAVAIVDEKVRNPTPGFDVVANALLEHDSPRIRARFLERSRNTGSPAIRLSARSLEHLAEDVLASDRRLAENALRWAKNIPSPVFAAAARARYQAASEDEKPQALHFLHLCARVEARPELEAALDSGNDDLWSVAVGAIVGDRTLESLPLAIASAGPAGRRTRDLSNSIVGRGGLDPASRRACAVAVIDALAPEQFDEDSVERYAKLFDEPHAPLVLRGMTATDAQARRMSCEIAANWCLEAAESRLVELLDRDVPDVAAEASRALVAIRARRDLKNSTRLALSFDKSQAIADAREILKSDDPTKRRGGALALGALGDVSAVPLLLKLLDDRDPQVRDAVLTALGKLESSPATTTTGAPKKSDG